MAQFVTTLYVISMYGGRRGNKIGRKKPIGVRVAQAQWTVPCGAQDHQVSCTNDLVDRLNGRMKNHQVTNFFLLPHEEDFGDTVNGSRYRAHRRSARGHHRWYQRHSVRGYVVAPDPSSFGLAVKSHWGSVETVRGEIVHGAQVLVNPS
jgi:hypothetical protein